MALMVIVQIFIICFHICIYNFCQFNSRTHSLVHANLIVCLFGQYLAGLFKLAVQVRSKLIQFFQIGRLFGFCRWIFIQILTSIDYSFIGYILRMSLFFASKYKSDIKCVSNKFFFVLKLVFAYPMAIYLNQLFIGKIDSSVS